ncbi:hypothetical protein VTN02DRAFT_900 [Thermoascus thermophilus]
MDQSLDDPLDWTVDQVVAYLCHNPATPWSQSATPAPRPDPASFEAALRDNVINGETLLNDVDRDTLRQDLGLKAVGHYSSIRRAIDHLRQLSVKYQRSLSRNPALAEHAPAFFSQGYVSAAASVCAPESPAQLPRFSPPKASAPQPRLPRPALLTPPGPGTIHHNGTGIGTLDQPIGDQPRCNVDSSSSAPPKGAGTELANFNNDTTSPRRDPNLHPRLEKQATASDLTPRLRKQEHYYVDERGKKKRRLDLSARTDAAADSVSTKKSRQASDLVQPGQWYMGPEKLCPSDFFYPILPDDEKEDSFTIISPGFPTAQRLFVNSCLNHFYRQQPISLGSTKGNEQWAVIPYNGPAIGSSKPQFFTLYSARDGKVTVSQEKIAEWPQLSGEEVPGPHSSIMSLKTRDPYHYLLEKYPVDDNDEHIYPLYGDSGSEGEYDPETWREIEDERQETTQGKPRYLTLDEVDSVIAQCVKDYEDKWRRDQLPREERKARRIWVMAKRNRSRNQQTKAILRDVSLLERRLKRIQKEIRLHDYVKVPDLQFQCQSMEQTIFNIEAQKWRISVLEQDKCPARAPLVPRQRPVPKTVSHPEDEESLHSESDGLEDSLDDFIDYDSDDSRPGSHDGPMELDEVQEEASASATAYIQSESSSDSDELISPSGARRKMRARRRESSKHTQPQTPSLPARKQGSPGDQFPLSRISIDGQEVECIDLTRNSPAPTEEFEIETPPLNPVRPSDEKLDEPLMKLERLSSSPSLLFPGELHGRENATSKNDDGSSHKRHSFPDVNDFKGISRILWDVLEERQDRQRLLTKLISSLPDEERDQMAKHIPRYDVSDLRSRVREALRTILNHAQQIRSLSITESQIIMRTASLYISWVNCVRLTDKGISKAHVRNALADKGSFETFVSQLSTRLSEYYDRRGDKAGARTTPETEENSSADELEHNLQEASSHTPHKKRKRQVKESHEVKRNLESAQRRVALQDEQRKRLERKLESLGVSNNDPKLQAVSFETPIIYLDPHIGQRVKPHQLSGIQFMWRELIQDEKREGCLLAHTMGLGKTMQVISLLVTISAAAVSKDPDVRKQVPECLRRSQHLILCPSSLIENWYEEFLMWTPRKNHLGQIRKITSASAFHGRIKELSAWAEDGGVLIMSYDIFRTWVLNNETKARGKPLQEDQHRRIKKQLLEGPSIIVADEAHKMKNRSAGIAAATSQFKSKSRIALTGSPLANNLLDYYAMVDWIAPGYLGNLVQFKANYVEPIEEGLYVDSTHAERRKSLKKLQVLKENLSPKVHRADISVLEGSLPPKNEFVITVPLTDLQKKSYDIYVNSVLARKGDVENPKLWSWLAILSLCCNHPACFRDKLLGQANDANKINGRSDDVDGEVMPGDESAIQAGLSEMMIAAQRELFANVTDLLAPELSHRAKIMDSIISESIKLGDKVLVFSHSLPTLDYIEYILQASNRNYRRLDGRTPIASRQAATKSFNQSGSDQQVYLISTRAGGLGLNIPGANRVIIFDFGFNPTWEEQAVGRAYRLGQQKDVFVYRFIAGGTFEEVIYNKAVFKTQLSFRVVDKKNPVRAASKSYKEYLFPVKKVKTEDVSRFKGKDSVLDKILEDDQQTMICKVALTETFQREDNDKLTEEEQKDVQQELDDEKLRRNDPEAYQKKFAERQAAMFAQRLPGPNSWNAGPPYYYDGRPDAYIPLQQNPAPMPPVPLAAHNVGPPPLAPDTSLLQRQPTMVTSPPAAVTPPIFSVGNTMPNRPVEPSASLSALNPPVSEKAAEKSTLQSHPAPPVMQNIGSFHMDTEYPRQTNNGSYTQARPEGSSKNTGLGQPPPNSPTPQSQARNENGRSGCKQQ